MALLLIGAACDRTGILGADSDVDGRSEESIAPGLVQSVSVRRTVLVGGNDIEVRSAISNRSTAPVMLVSRVCGFDYAGSLQLTEVPGILKCAAHSSTFVLAAGDSVVATDLMRTTSPAGTYTLRVRHALVPEFWASVPVVVLP